MPKSVFPYVGSKRQYADWIIDHIPEHHCYVEAFGGCGAVLTHKDRSKVEVYNDINGDLVHFFRTLRSHPDELKEELQSIPFAREIHTDWENEWAEGNRPTDDVERAVQFFYLRYTKYGGALDTISGFRVSSGRNQARAYANKVDIIGEFAERFRSVVIEQLDWVDLIERYDSEDTLFYLDPPYDGTEFRYQDCDIDHKQLPSVLNNANGNWILSCLSAPAGLEYKTRVEYETSHGSNNHQDESVSVSETLVMNFDPEQTPRFDSANQSTLTAHVER